MSEPSERLTDEELHAAAEQAREIAGEAGRDERQEELARMEADAAEQLQRNADALRRTAEDLVETREQVQRIAANTRELAADVRATREDTSRVGEVVRDTPPVVEPPADAT
jgi:hypothetical protein